MTDDLQRIRKVNAELRQKLLRHMEKPCICPTAIDGLHLVRREDAGTPEVCFEKPSVLEGRLDAHPGAQAFTKMLPITISMGQYGGREFYGPIRNTISTRGEGELRFDNGDVTYCPRNNTIAIFCAQTDRPNLTMRVFRIGKVISDLSVFRDMPQSVQMTFSLKK